MASEADQMFADLKAKGYRFRTHEVVEDETADRLTLSDGIANAYSEIIRWQCPPGMIAIIVGQDKEVWDKADPLYLYLADTTPTEIATNTPIRFQKETINGTEDLGHVHYDMVQRAANINETYKHPETYVLRGGEYFIVQANATVAVDDESTLMRMRLHIGQPAL